MLPPGQVDTRSYRGANPTIQALGSRPNLRASSANFGAVLDWDVSSHPVTPCTPYRDRVPPSAYLLGICRRGHRPLRAVGRWLDDACALVPLSPPGHIGPRFRPAIAARTIALVPALALRPLARHQLRRRGCAATRLRLWRVTCRQARRVARLTHIV